MSKTVKQTEKKSKFGNLPGAGPGRPKGKPNKSTSLIKDAIIEAAVAAGDKAGMVGYLTTQAKENPTAFMGLMGKALPLQLQNADEEGFVLKVVTGVTRADD